MEVEVKNKQCPNCPRLTSKMYSQKGPNCRCDMQMQRCKTPPNVDVIVSRVNNKGTDTKNRGTRLVENVAWVAGKARMLRLICWYYLLRCSVSEVEARVSPSHIDVSLEDLLVLEGLLLLDEMLELEPTVHSSSDTPV